MKKKKKITITAHVNIFTKPIELMMQKICPFMNFNFAIMGQGDGFLHRALFKMRFIPSSANMISAGKNKPAAERSESRQPQCGPCKPGLFFSPII